MSNDFNYDGDDIPLDENGLPIYTDEDENDDESSSTMDLMNQIRDARDSYGQEDYGEEDEDEGEDAEEEEEEDSSGGRYGDNNPLDSKLKSSKSGDGNMSSKFSGKGGRDNWFSKFTKGGKGFGTGGGAGAGAGAGAAGAGGAGAGAAGAGAAGAAGAGAGGGVVAGLGFGWWIVLIILAVILVIVVIVSIVAYFQAKTDPDNMKSNEYVTSEYFYGTRSVYIDEQTLTDSLQLSYKQYVIDVITNIETNNPEVDIIITLPNLDENNILNNSTPIDENITDMSIGIANIIATGSSDSKYSDFSVLYSKIDYFGLTQNQGEKVNTFLIEYFTTNTDLITSSSGEPNINQLINSAVSSPELQYIYNRCEKVMIKDEIASEKGLENIEQRQYVASIYMPNKNIIIENSTYTIASFYDSFSVKAKLIEENGGTQTIHSDKSILNKADITAGVNYGKVNLNTFTSIDTENIEAFSSGLSLFDALKMSENYKQYFTQDAETQIYSWKPTDSSLLYFTYEADKMFIFTDFDLNIKLP